MSVEYRNRYNALLAAHCLDSDLRLGIPVVPLVLRTPVNILVIRLTSVLLPSILAL